MNAGDKVQMSTTHSDGSVIRYAATIRQITSNGVWLEIPERVRKLPFAPYSGHRYVQIALSSIHQPEGD